MNPLALAILCSGFVIGTCLVILHDLWQDWKARRHAGSPPSQEGDQR